MELMPPNLKYFASYKNALQEFETSGISGFWKLFGPVDDAEAYLESIRDHAHPHAGDGLVPATVFWLIDCDEFVGHISIRHELNPALKRVGGHIGYAVRPTQQGKGYGSTLLKLALPKARELGIRTALITCDKANSASRKIIEKNGGVFQKELTVEGKKVLHFIIDTHAHEEP